jgi:hypothetical protein
MQTRASGDFFVVIGRCVRPGNTWDTTELPTLQKRGKVKCVFQFTTKDNWANPTLVKEGYVCCYTAFPVKDMYVKIYQWRFTERTDLFY